MPSKSGEAYWRNMNNLKEAFKFSRNLQLLCAVSNVVLY